MSNSPALPPACIQVVGLESGEVLVLQDGEVRQALQLDAGVASVVATPKVGGLGTRMNHDLANILAASRRPWG